MTDKNVVFNCDTFTNEGVAGDFAVTTHLGVLLDLNKCTDLRLGSDFTTVEVDELR